MNVPLYYTMTQCDEATVANISMPYIKSLYSCLNRVVGDGYTEEFKQEGKVVRSKKTNRVYPQGEIKVINFFRFEGNTNPDDNVIMYIIETTDGLKGTLVNAYNTSSEQKAGNLFMVENDNIQ